MTERQNKTLLSLTHECNVPRKVINFENVYSKFNLLKVLFIRWKGLNTIEKVCQIETSHSKIDITHSHLVLF